MQEIMMMNIEKKNDKEIENGEITIEINIENIKEKIYKEE